MDGPEIRFEKVSTIPSGYATQGDLANLKERIDELVGTLGAPADAGPKVPPMPPEIAKAIVAVMGEVKKLTKEGENKYQKYNFTSVDQFYEALGPIMAKHGLLDMALERSITTEIRETVDDYGKAKKSAWLIAEYDFWLYHESGASFGPVTRSIQVTASGPQSYAAAQSFVEKYFLRNLFKIATGDVDEVDEAPKEGLPQTREQPVRGKQTITSGREPEAKRPSLEPGASAMSLAAMLASLDACDTRQAIAGWSTKNGDEKERLLPEDREKLKEAFVAKQAAVKQAAGQRDTVPAEQAQAA